MMQNNCILKEKKKLEMVQTRKNQNVSFYFDTINQSKIIINWEGGFS